MNYDNRGYTLDMSEPYDLTWYTHNRPLPPYWYRLCFNLIFFYSYYKNSDGFCFWSQRIYILGPMHLEDDTLPHLWGRLRDCLEVKYEFFLRSELVRYTFGSKYYHVLLSLLYINNYYSRMFQF